jgi:hypothetical protein
MITVDLENFEGHEVVVCKHQRRVDVHNVLDRILFLVLFGEAREALNVNTGIQILVQLYDLTLYLVAFRFTWTTIPFSLLSVLIKDV